MSCLGKRCGFNIDLTRQAVGCSQGDGSCFDARILSAAQTDFHDQALIDATSKIQEIIRNIPADSKDRQLSFLNTNMGLLLAWVEHDQPIPAGAITGKHPDTAIASALRLSFPSESK